MATRLLVPVRRLWELVRTAAGCLRLTGPRKYTCLWVPYFDPFAAQRSSQPFSVSFESKYGTEHPAFLQCGFSEVPIFICFDQNPFLIVVGAYNCKATTSFIIHLYSKRHASRCGSHRHAAQCARSHCDRIRAVVCWVQTFAARRYCRVVAGGRCISVAGCDC